MKGEKGLSGRLTLALAALLCLLFGLSLLLLPGAGAAAPTEIQAAASIPERTLTGGDDADRLPTELLPGEKLSAAIVSWREEHGRFQSVEELLQVPGIGEKRLAEIRGLVTVG